MSYTEAIKQLSESINQNWDADDEMDIDYCFSTPEGKYVKKIHDCNQKSLEWLCSFISRKVLKCWEISCESQEPRNLVSIILNYILNENDEIFKINNTLINSPHSDCRHSETQSTADSIYHAIEYIRTKNPIYAIYCISDADCAFDHVFTEENYREWLIEIAIPHSVKLEELPSEYQF